MTMEFTGERFVPTEAGEIRQEHLHRYSWCLAALAGKDVLDIASGEGYGSAAMAAVARSVVGVDISPEAIAHARVQYAGLGNLDFRQGSAASIPLPDSFVDVVVSFETVEHLREQEQMLAEIRRVLRPDGFLVMSSPNRLVYSEKAGHHNEFHVRELDFEELSVLLATQFPAIRFVGHRLTVCSAIAPLAPEVGSQEWHALTDVGGEVAARVASIADPVYFIALAAASESFLPPLGPSIMMSESEDLYEHHREVARWAQSQDAEVQSLRALSDERTAWALGLDRDVKELRAANAAQQAELDGRAEWAQRLDSEIASLRVAYDRLRVEEDEARSRAVELQLELKGTRDTMLEQAASLRLLEGELAGAKDEVQSISGLLQVLQVQASDAAARLELARADAAAADEARRREVGEVRRELAAVLGSRSWKLTKPLRFAGKLVRGDWPAVIDSLRGSPLARSAVLSPLRVPVKNWLMRRARGSVQAVEGLALTEVEADQHAVIENLSFPHVDSPVVTIIVPTYGNFPYSLACIRSIAKARTLVSFEVLVVEDASGDPDIGKLATIDGLRYHENPQNLGFLMSCNGALGMARGKFVCYLNNDTEVRDGWLDALVDVFRGHADAGLVGAKLVYPDGRQQEAGGIVWADASAWNFGRLQDPQAAPFNYLHESDYISGAAIMAPRALLDELEGFDPLYLPAYCEDTDLAFRIRERGLKVYYQPAAVVVHHEGISHGTDTGSGIKAYQVANQGKFRERWRATLEREHFANGELPFLARDRSQLRKTVLVIDHYVPQPDRDAGSRTMWQFMSLFRKKGLSVKFWPENLWYDPVYTPRLQQAGVEVFYGHEYGGRFEEWIRENGACIDYVLLSRPHISVHFVEALRRHTDATLLYYGHDIHHHRLAAQLALGAEDGEAIAEEMRSMQALEERVWESVDTVYYPSVTETTYVESWMQARSRADGKAFTIPVYAFETFPEDPGAGLEDRRDLLFVAGFGHSPNGDAAVWFVNEVMPLLSSRKPGLRVHLVGSNPTPAVRNLASETVNVTGFVSDEELVGYYERCRVVVAPLRYGGGMKGKVVEAMRFGVPTVTSPAGAQGLASAAGFLAVADSAGEFADAVLGLLEDDARWLGVSAEAQAFAKARFSEDALWKIVAEDVDASPYPDVEARRARVASVMRNRS